MSDGARAICWFAVAMLAQTALAQEPVVGDPMRPPGTAVQSSAAAPAAPVLTAVLISPTRRIAVIDGQLYSEGDLVGGARLRQIRHRSVELERANTLQVLALASDNP